MTPHFPLSSEAFDLPAHGSAPPQRHVFEPAQSWAIRAALTTGRPLLLRGEPGTGKSQLARAAAHVLRRPWLTAVVTSQSSSEDLLWEFDAVARLGNAQVLGALASAGGDGWRKILRPARFVRPGPLWWAFDWNSATTQLDCYHEEGAIPPYYDPGRADPANGVVLLIDEIDKADSDLPNGLLDALGNGGFQPPHGVPPVQQGNCPTPLVVITTNEERELPAAFLRRCLVLNLELPGEDEGLAKFLVDRGAVHFPTTPLAIREEVAKQLIAERKAAGSAGLPRPGQAEYLDLLRAVLLMEKVYGADHATLLQAVQPFALKKQPRG